MVLPIWNFQVLKKVNLHVEVAKLSGLFSKSRKRLQQLLFVARVGRKFGDQGLNPAAVRAKTVHLIRLWLFTQLINVPANAIKDKPGLTLIMSRRAVVSRSAWTHNL